MTPKQHTRAKELFLAACARPPAERDAFVRQSCGDDDVLRAAVETLLRHRDEAPSNEDPLRTATRLLPSLGLQLSFGRRPSVTSSGVARDGKGFEAGTLIADRYRIISRLGQGGMGEVYRAHDLTLDQPIAMKFLLAEIAHEPVWLQRFLNEVRVARQIAHPNVCRVYDVGQAGSDYFISMEYVDGEDLATLLRRIGRLPSDKALDIAHQLCGGLAAAHAKGVLHRDLKPANIMLDGEGRVRITDFGLAGHREQIKGAELRAGTPAYMAPEQLSGQDVSPRSDIYSLGLVLYELFTGKPAFRAEHIEDLMRLQRDAAPPTPSSVMHDIAPAVERTILRCLDKNPDRRPRSALAVAALLPGGDVLSAAMAAGETPSPEVVAAAGESLKAGRQTIVGGLIAFLAMMAVILTVPPTPQTPDWRGMTLSPEVLAHRAQELIEQLGGTPNPRDEAWGFEVDPACEFMNTPDTRPDQPVPTFALHADNDVLFWYRRNDAPLVPITAENLVFGRGAVRLTDPPPHQPGMCTIKLDPMGHLVGFEALPRHCLTPHESESEFDWTPLLKAAGLELADLHAATPLCAPRLPADVRMSWEGQLPGHPEIPVRVEAAAYHGRPMTFVVLNGTPNAPEAVPWRMIDLRKLLVMRTEAFLFAALIVLAAPLAYINRRRGRGDERGASRLCAFVMLARMTAWLLQAHHVADADAELLLISYAVVGALGEGVAMWLFYMALEPYVRRFWPHMLISWSRLLAGRWRDGRVGQDLLLGATLGTVFYLLMQLDWYATGWLGFIQRMPWRSNEEFTSVLGGRQALAMCIEALRYSVYKGMFLLLILALLRVFLRRALPASIIAVILTAPMFVPRGSHPLVSWIVIGICGVGLAVWVMQRFGLIAVMAGLFVASMLSLNPLTLDTRVWYADTSFFALLVVMAVAIGGFVATWRPPTYMIDSGLLGRSR
ncbi:MAG: serine/threonine protein kinase [Phycisphaerae bacterium]|nr:serine/threonine protein kinase [Phycisphaerae bacterium]